MILNNTQEILPSITSCKNASILSETENENSNTRSLKSKNTNKLVRFLQISVRAASFRTTRLVRLAQLQRFKEGEDVIKILP